MVPRVAGCEEKCSLCGKVCPTVAIRKLPLKEKQFVKIGTAVIDRHRCLTWEQNKECLVCDEVCPYNAIKARVIETVTGKFKVPVINEDLCLGCGMCEQHCPIFDIAAVVVYKFGKNRMLEGAYTTDFQKKRILDRRRTSDSVHLGNTVQNPSVNNGLDIYLYYNNKYFLHVIRFFPNTIRFALFQLLFGLIAKYYNCHASSLK